ncbi:hypothetical protein [Planctomicrobium sp. SH664]|uniref:hypothetical protein n=1 Tax=Planctomicrobium sp. SH664 TaxID=3448125 RepID=UPI003F5C8C30
MTTMTGVYLAYLTIGTGLILWVGRTLLKYGRILIVGQDQRRVESVEPVSHLLVVGFYLVTLGVLSLLLKSRVHITGVQPAVELLSEKIGLVLLLLGGMHFCLMIVFSVLRREVLDEELAGRETAISELAAKRAGKVDVD